MWARYVILGILSLSGCTPKAVLDDQDRQHSLALHERSPELAGMTEPNSVWHTLHDPCLNELLEHARTYSTDLKLAKKNYAATLAQYELSWAHMQPTWAPSATFSTGNVARNHVKFPDYSRYTLNTALTIDLWGSQRYELKGRLAAVYAQAAQFKNQEILIYSAVAQSYLILLAIEEQILIHQKRRNLLEEQQKIVEKEQTHGIKTAFDVNTHTLLIANNSIHIGQLEHMRVLYRSTLAQLTGYPEHALPIRPRPLPKLPKTSPIDEPFASVRSRPDISFFEYEYLKTRMHREATERSQYPNISLSHVLNLFYAPGNYSANPWSLSALFSSDHLFAAAGSAEKKQAKAQEEISYAAWIRALEYALNDIHQAEDAYRTHCLRHQQEVYKTEVYTEQAELVRRQLRSGLISPPEALEHSLKMLQQKSEELDSLIEAYQSLADLYRSLGRH